MFEGGAKRSFGDEPVLHVDTNALFVHPACARFRVMLLEANQHKCVGSWRRSCTHRQVGRVLLARLSHLELAIVCPQLITINGTLSNAGCTLVNNERSPSTVEPPLPAVFEWHGGRTDQLVRPPDSTLGSGRGYCHRHPSLCRRAARGRYLLRVPALGRWRGDGRHCTGHGRFAVPGERGRLRRGRGWADARRTRELRG